MKMIRYWFPVFLCWGFFSSLQLAGDFVNPMSNFSFSAGMSLWICLHFNLNYRIKPQISQ